MQKLAARKQGTSRIASGDHSAVRSFPIRGGGEEDSAYQIQDAKHRLLGTFRDSARWVSAPEKNLNIINVREIEQYFL